MLFIDMPIKSTSKICIITGLIGLSLSHFALAQDNQQDYQYDDLSDDLSGQNHVFPDITTQEPLDEKQLYDVFAGQTHNGSYSFLREDINTYAFTETTFKDGRILHVQSLRDKVLTDRGQWDIDGNEICYDYDNDRLRQACFHIYQAGNCYYHYQISVQGFPASGFTARSVLKGETPNCEPAIA